MPLSGLLVVADMTTRNLTSPTLHYKTSSAVLHSFADHTVLKIADYFKSIFFKAVCANH
jgi:hypothetical protein